MDTFFELHVALRYLLARRKQARIGVISTLSALGVSVGVMAVIVALAIMTGLQQEVRDRLLGSNAHVYVWRIGGIVDYRAEAEKLAALPGVAGAAPAVLGPALISSTTGESFVTLKGIDPQLEPQVTDIVGSLESGSLAALDPPDSETPGGILLGTNLADKLGVLVGDEVLVLTPEGSVSPWGLLPKPPRRLRVAGVFSLGLYEFDSTYGFVSLGTAEKLLGKAEVDFIQLRVDDLDRAPVVASAVEALGTEYLTEDWQSMNRSLFSALWLEKIAISLAIGLIIFVAALNIVTSLILIVTEKVRDIAILKTMGASARSVTTIFMLQGVIIGIVGTTCGAAVGCAVAFVADHYQLIRVPMDVYQVSHLPLRVLPLNLAFVVLGAMVVCFVATIYPSRQAARTDPAQALRYE